jgi:hypothetical protein
MKLIIKRLNLWVALGAALWLGLGCAHYRLANDVQVPFSKSRIYVPVFVDETVEGTLGFDVSNALRIKILHRQPRRLAGHMEQGVLAVDGTILKLNEKPRYSGDEGRLVAGTYVLKLEVSVHLNNHEGKRLKKLGRYAVEEEYITEKEMERTEEGRRRALVRAAMVIAERILDDIDQLGRDKKR